MNQHKPGRMCHTLGADRVLPASLASALARAETHEPEASPALGLPLSLASVRVSVVDGASQGFRDPAPGRQPKPRCSKATFGVLGVHREVS